MKIALDLQFHGDGRLGIPLLDRPPGVLEFFLQLRLPDLVRGLTQPPCRLRVVASRALRGFVESTLEILHSLVHLIFPLSETVNLSLSLGPTFARKFPDVSLNLPLLTLQLLHVGDGILRIASGALGAGVLQLAPGVFETAESGIRFGHGLRPTGACGLSHIFRRLLQIPRRLLQPRIIHLTGEPLKLSRSLLGLLCQAPLCITAAALSILVGGRASLTLGHLLLPTGQLLELLQQLVDLVVRLLLLASLHRLVLILELVELEFEQIGEVIGRLLAAPAAPTALLLLLLDVSLVGLLGLLQEAQGLLLIGHRFLQFLGLEVFDRS